MKQPKFIGTISLDEIVKTITDKPWESIALDSIPYSVVKPSPNYLFTLGSGCYSLPTTSIYGQEYNSGIDVFRQDYENGKVVIDIDHYIARPCHNSLSVYLEPKDQHHQLSINDQRINDIKPGWKFYLKDKMARESRLTPIEQKW